MAYLESATIVDLERIRVELRALMRFRRKQTTGSLPPLVINIKEEPGSIKSIAHKPKLEGLALAHYRNRVEGVLRSLMEESAALKKIRAGLPVSHDDLEELTNEVLLHDPDLHLEELLVHYPNKAKRIDLAIRQIIGLDAAKVDEHFRAFVQKYPALNSNQIRFLELLKAHVARYGAIELEKLWDAPFTSIHGSGVDGVFTNSTQVDDLLNLLSQLNEQAA
jgi:type I restriction enzyme R subunit